MKLLRFALSTALLCGLTGCAQVNRKETFRDGNIHGGEMSAPVDGFIAHRSPKNYLVVGSKTYTNVRGLPPHYLKVPGSSRILFVTGTHEQGATIHIMERDGSGRISIPASTDFGSNIGGVRGPGNRSSDSVRVTGPDQLTLVHDQVDWKSTVILDLKAQRVLNEDPGPGPDRSLEGGPAPRFRPQTAEPRRGQIPAWQGAHPI